MEWIHIRSSPTATLRPHRPLPRLRSRGGWGRGSLRPSPGWRNPRAETPRTSGPPPQSSSEAARSGNVPPLEFVEGARSDLMRHRSFRISQLDQLAVALVNGTTGSARTEIDLALRAAAQSVLVDIDAALHRIEQGTYGRCPNCGAAMSVERLSALPMAAVCGPCQRTQELCSGDDVSGPAAGPRPGRGSVTSTVSSKAKCGGRVSSQPSRCVREQRASGRSRTL